MSPLGITLRLVVDTEPKSQWGVERELRLRFKEAFDREGIPLEVHQPPPAAT
jgi:small conductance mechanosensitive channel